MDQFKIDFLCIGAVKAGTTWLTKTLSQHPYVYIPPQKEIHYFNKKFDSGLINTHCDKPLSWYAEHFRAAQPHQLTGEITPSYLWNNSAHAIYEHNPDVKLIAILRNPIDRAFSHYLYFTQKGHIYNKTFEQALEDGHVIAIGKYYEQLKDYFTLFPRKNILILLHEDLRKPAHTMRTIERFLGIPPHTYTDINARRNVTRQTKLPIINRIMAVTRTKLRKHNMHRTKKFLQITGIHQLIRCIYRLNSAPFKEKPRMNPQTRKTLRNTYQSDITQLETLINRDLSHWK